MKLKRTLFLSFFYLITQFEISGQSINLSVGDYAPKIKVLGWLKGSPFTTFEKGQVYLVEFGSTWCIPCAATIPHLNQIGESNGNKVNIVSIFVMEYKKDSNDLSYLQTVNKYLGRDDRKINYNVAVDD